MNQKRRLPKEVHKHTQICNKWNHIVICYLLDMDTNSDTSTNSLLVSRKQLSIDNDNLTSNGDTTPGKHMCYT